MKKSNLFGGKWLGKTLFLLCLSVSTLAIGQTQYSFSGTVTDAGNDIPIPSASVVLENLSIGASADFDGNYAFTATLSEGEYVLVASSLGYSTKRIPISLGSSTEITTDITMSEDLLSLDEVVVTGTTVGVNKRTLGNAISSVKAEDLVNNGATAVDQAISGKITGALVQQNSGDPAGGISIRLRGPSTVLGNSDPLYIVDGILISNSSN
ncbi:MAG: carboxypeptidase-like regulatory domain-containing protein, partial [Bacteroidota bacterium]